ncbi:MAG: alcohol dehydrogenase catalytic domain-containing protein [Nitriliruptoraceae bacterium]
MNIAASMQALVPTQSGFAKLAPPTAIESLEPYLAHQTVKTPSPAKGQVLIRVTMAPVNPSDVAFITGFYGQPRVVGIPAGFEGVGQVVACGGGAIAERLVGRRVSFFAGVSGSWAQYAVAEAKTCIPLRSKMRDEDGAALLVNPLSAWALYDIVSRSDSKAFVMTAAASQLCKLLTLLAAKQGYRPISLVRRDEQIGLLTDLGSTHVLNTEADGFSETLKSVLAVERPRILLDALSGPVAGSVFQQMGRNSRWIIYGGLDVRPARLPDVGQLVFEGKRVEGFWLTSWIADASLVRLGRAALGVQGLFIDGTWTTDVTATVPLTQAHQAIPAALAKPNAGKVMLTPNS